MASEKTIKIMHWIPRVLCILAILFVSMFALDAFNSNQTIWQQIGGFIMHLIPSFILLAIFIAACKYELIGGIIFTVIGVVLTPFIFNMNYNMNHSIGMSLIVIASITLPFIFIGILFIISHYLKKKQKLIR